MQCMENLGIRMLFFKSIWKVLFIENRMYADGNDFIKAFLSGIFKAIYFLQ